MKKLQTPISKIFDRIEDSKRTVLDGIKTDNTTTINNGIEPLAITFGRVLTELASGDTPTMLEQGFQAILDSQELMNNKDLIIDNLTVSGNPSSWVSFDGEIKTPLYVKKSNIKNAGNGLFTERHIKKGECIGPSRVKKDNTGDFFKDWEKFPIAAMINHHPIPNVSVVRGDPPFGMNKMFGETCYFVANRDIDAHEELTSDYRDKGWAEWDYYDEIPLPFDVWDNNCINQKPNITNLGNMIVKNPNEYIQTLGWIGGPLLYFLSTKQNTRASKLLSLTGFAWISYSAWKKYHK